MDNQSVAGASHDDGEKKPTKEGSTDDLESSLREQEAAAGQLERLLDVEEPIINEPSPPSPESDSSRQRRRAASESEADRISHEEDDTEPRRELDLLRVPDPYEPIPVSGPSVSGKNGLVPSFLPPDDESGLSPTSSYEKKKLPLRKVLILLSLTFINFGTAVCVSLQAPFYPQEAEKKGASATEYGLVFGVFELVVFFISPVYGRYLTVIGPKFMVNAGIFIAAVCAILFGMLEHVQGHVPFIALSFAVRIVEATGEAAYLTGSFSIIAQEFPETVATTFASLETSFGLGLIAGPLIGGALYQIGGYSLPFLTMGSVLLLTTVIVFLLLPPIAEGEAEVKTDTLGVLRVPAVALAMYTTFCGSCSIGFIVALLEPHIRMFGMRPVVNGILFVISGGVYAVTAPIWGRICDRTGQTKLYCAIGGVIAMMAYALLGPLPFIPAETTLWMVVIALVFHGLGVGGELVCSFIGGLKEAVKHGYPDNLSTYGVVSALWSSTFALGAFVGPSVAGVLYDHVGFRWASVFVFCLHGILAIFTISYLSIRKYNKQSQSVSYIESSVAEEKTPLLSHRVYKQRPSITGSSIGGAINTNQI